MESKERQDLKLLARIYKSSRDELEGLLPASEAQDLTSDSLNNIHRAYNHFLEQFDNLSALREEKSLSVQPEKDRFFTVRQRAISVLETHGIMVGAKVAESVSEDQGMAVVMAVPSEEYKSILVKAQDLVLDISKACEQFDVITQEYGAALEDVLKGIDSVFRKLDSDTQDIYQEDQTHIKNDLNDYALLFDHEQVFISSVQQVEAMLNSYESGYDVVNAAHLEECVAVNKNFMQSFEKWRDQVRFLGLISVSGERDDLYSDLVNRITPVLRSMEDKVQVGELTGVVVPIDDTVVASDSISNPVELRDVFSKNLAEIEVAAMNLRINFVRYGSEMSEEVSDTIQDLDDQLEQTMSVLRDAFDGHTTFIKAEQMRYDKVKENIAHIQDIPPSIS